MRFVSSILLIALAAGVARPCSICGGDFLRRQTLRERHADARLVLLGELRNPKANPDGIGGTTEFHVTQTLKGDNAPKLLTIPRYLPVIGQTPPEYLFFCSVVDGKVDPVTGLAATADLLVYRKGAFQFEEKNKRSALAYFFSHLEAKDETVAQDSFLEIAKVSDADLQACAEVFDRRKLRGWIADDKVPAERLGVYALLLGLSGNIDDARWLSDQLKLTPRPERYSANLGGLLAGLALLEPKSGWPIIQESLKPEASIVPKISAIGTLRYFQATRPEERRTDILQGMKSLLATADLADMAIDDLRRWGWWDLTDDVLKCFDKADYSSPLMRRGIVRYALACPNAEAKSFIDKVRSSDPKLVAKVEETMKK